MGGIRKLMQPLPERVRFGGKDKQEPNNVGGQKILKPADRTAMTCVNNRSTRLPWAGPDYCH